MNEVDGIFNSKPLVPLMLQDSEEEPLTPTICYSLKATLIYHLAHSTQISFRRVGVGLKQISGNRN